MVKKTVRFSLLLHDDFTGKCITQGGHLFKLNGRPVTPVHKPEGFYVFLEPVESRVEVEISGGAYCTCSVAVQVDKLDPAFPVVHVRLMRSRAFGSADCEQIQGAAKPGAVVYALKAGTGANKLLSIKDVEGGKAIGFSGYLLQSASEKRFMLGTGKTKEVFVAGDCLPDKTYTLRQPLKHSHKAGEPVIRAFAAMCDENGFYSIPVEKGQQEQIKEVHYYDEEGKKWVCLSLTAHK